MINKSLILPFFAWAISLSSINSDIPAQVNRINVKDIHIRDPFIIADEVTETYYMYASIANRLFTTDSLQGVEVYTSKDLETWSEPVPVFIVDKNFWGQESAWAPEVHQYNGKYYLFVTFTSDESLPVINDRPALYKRGTQILVSASPTGPFAPFHNRSHTPQDWMALDGTLWVENNKPYMIFCHEWIQMGDGTIELVGLKKDLSDVKGKPETLFKASDASWVRDLKVAGADGTVYKSLVTDGPFIYQTKNNKLLMIWSSFGDDDYAVGVAESTSGSIKGPWRQKDKPLYGSDGGHGMIFRTFDGRMMLSIHQPNKNPDERAKFIELVEKDDMLYVNY
ncbi:MAG: family 43 glycosylhydrolase [Bacteroidales bacterium]|nr:family 43 glycosylhydrolase [Bacteroidales bacterium]